MDLKKTKLRSKKKRMHSRLGKSKGVKRKATILVSKKIVKEAKLRNMTLSDYIKQQKLDIVPT